MSGAVVGQPAQKDQAHEDQAHEDQAHEDFASEALTTVTPPPPPSATEPPSAIEPSAAPEPTEAQIPHGMCVNCGRPVTLRRVGTDQNRHTYQWVPDDEPARPGRHCYEGFLPAYHWADGATAAVYHFTT